MTPYAVIAASRTYFAAREDGVPTAAPDEDPFTLAVAAGELLEPVRARVPSQHPWTVWVSGPRLPSSPEDLPLALGASPAPVLSLSEAAPLPDLPKTGAGSGGALWIHVGGREGGARGSATALLLAPPNGTLDDRLSAGSVDDLIHLLDRLGAKAIDPDPRGLLPKYGEWVPGPARGPEPVVGGRTVLEPSLDSVSEGAYLSWAVYREGIPSRWRFAADRCGRCGQRTFPALGRCEKCGERAGLEREELPRNGGIIEAITTIHSGAQPTEFDFQVEQGGPYDVALVRLAPGVIATLQVTEAAPGTVRVGDRVDTCLRRLYPMEGRWRYGRKARPMPPATATG